MEAAGLYWTAQRLGKRALAILDDLRPHLHRGVPSPLRSGRDSFHEMMEIALETAWKSLEG